MRIRRIGQAGAVIAMVLAATVVLPGPAASASIGDWLDTTFGAGGISILPGEESFFPGGTYAIDSADRSYVATSDSSSVTRVRRLTVDGQIDPTFAGGATVTRAGQPGTVHVDAGGTVTLATIVAPQPGALVSRFTVTGDPDPGFGSGGTVSILDGQPLVHAKAILDRPGGGVLVVLATFSAPVVTYLVALTSTGALDPTWAPGAPQPGVLVVPGGALAAGPDGDQVVVLSHFDSPSLADIVMRFTATGAIDTGFGSGGQFVLPDISTFIARTMVVSDGAYLVGGLVVQTNPAYSIGVARVVPAGALDPTFGVGGLAQVPSPAGPCAAVVNKLAVSGGRIMVSASATCSPTTTILARITASGEPDPTFATAGQITFDTVAGFQSGGASAQGLTVQSTGRVLVWTLTGRFYTSVFRLRDDQAPPAAGTFRAVEPGRLLDTRIGTGAPAGVIPPGGSLDLQVTGQGGVPASGVGAVVLNVTVTQPTSDGNIVVFPTGSPVPLASNLNFVAGQTIPNLVTVKVGTDGKVTLRNNSAAGSVHLVADIAGYYVAGTATLAGTFTPVTPARLLDTRSGNGAPAGTVAPGAAIDLQVTGRGGVPATGVGVVVLNVTVTRPSTDGNIQAYPGGTPGTDTSSLNFLPGQTIPNLVTVKVGAAGTVALRNNSAGTVHLVADVAGYYLTGRGVVPGSFAPQERPIRVLDTRNGQGGPIGPVPAGGVITVPLSQLPVRVVGPAAVVMNVTVTQPTWDGSVVAFPAGATPPLASNVNFVAGQTIPNLVIVKAADGTGLVSLKNNAIQGTVHLVVDVAGYFVS